MGSDNFQTDKTEKASSTAKIGKLLPRDFLPGRYDVVCQRGKLALGHEGNATFRKLIKKALPQYSEAIHKWEKTGIVTAIIETIKNKSKGGGFIRKVDDRWYLVGDLAAREKIGQCLRDFLHDKYRSSTRAKALRRNTSNGEGVLEDLPDRRSLHGQNADSETEDIEEQNGLSEEEAGAIVAAELQANFIRSFQLRSPLEAHLGPMQYSYEQYRAALEAANNSHSRLQGQLRSTANYSGESARTERDKAIASSSADKEPRKLTDRNDSIALARSSDIEAAKPRPSGIPNQVDTDIQAALDSILPPADQEALDEFCFSSMEALVEQLKMDS